MILAQRNVSARRAQLFFGRLQFLPGEWQVPGKLLQLALGFDMQRSLCLPSVPNLDQALQSSHTISQALRILLQVGFQTPCQQLIHLS
ncbi:hypothetical protein SDC9_186425 [bioreactor metagenome]|uniref:Uncharacterized protein n=1 Tax=bioreactor metagenome TaxID=1076179 RepID=A0A645HJH7_9ZZZZ